MQTLLTITFGGQLRRVIKFSAFVDHRVMGRYYKAYNNSPIATILIETLQVG